MYALDKGHSRATEDSGAGVPGGVTITPQGRWSAILVKLRMRVLNAIRASSAGPAGSGVHVGIKKVERRELWLWSTVVLVNLLLASGLVIFLIPLFHEKIDYGAIPLSDAVRALVLLVILFDIYVIYQQIHIARIRRRFLEREELFRLISENAADMIAVVDGKGKRLYNSPAYEKVLGYTIAELQETSAFEQIHPEDLSKVKQANQEALQGNPGRQIEYRMRAKEGGWRLLESTASTIRDKNGNVEKLVIVNRDVTERRTLENQFRQAQKMEAVGRLSGGIAHDFNNILGVIIGYCEILLEKTDASDPKHDYTEEVLDAARRAASLTRQLLAFSRQQVLAPRVLDLNAVITDTEKMLRRLIGEDIDLKTILDPNLSPVKADQSQIEQVILNLAVNARDAMPSGGKLVIKTGSVTIDAGNAQRGSYTVNPGRYVLISVRDTGTGMDTATQARIFEPFFTTKEKGKGTGLGLATIYGVVKQSDGYIEVESEPGMGSEFKIYLPEVQDSPISDAGRVGPEEAIEGNETVLLVEDEAQLRSITCNILESLGYRILAASDGAQALAVSQGYEGVIDLVLTDVIMPRMNGPELAKEITLQRPEVKTLYISGYTGQGLGSEVLPEGSQFLPKPFTRHALARKVREVLSAHMPMATRA
jgi:two-component system, cell cycle sensor histidine kinase and response regulator CckA